MLPRQIDDALEDFFGVNGAGGIVGIDHNNTARARCDFLFDVGQVRLSAILFITNIVHRFAAAERGGSCPQRIIGSRDQNFIAIVEQGL